jgi:lysophospholipase L1-like esterase
VPHVRFGQVAITFKQADEFEASTVKRFLSLMKSGVTLLVSIFTGEMFLRIFLPLPDPYKELKTPSHYPHHYIPSQFPPNFRLTMKAEEGLPGVLGENLFSTNNMGFRGDYLASPKPDQEFRIFLVGASTTQCILVDDAQAINKVLQDELTRNIPRGMSVKVYDASKTGDRSYDHIAIIVHRIVHLQPDLIVILSGFSDLNASIKNADYLHYRANSYQVKLAFPTLVKMLATEFQLGRRAHYLFSLLSGKTANQIFEGIPVRTNYGMMVKVRMSVPVSNMIPRTNLAPYRNNLTTIAGVAKAHGVRLVFVTQPNSWNSSIDPSIKNWHWMSYRAGTTYSEVAMEDALTAFNNVMIEVAAEQGIPLCDLAKSIPKSTEFFFDDVHFNVKGAHEVGIQLASFIVIRDLIPHDGKRKEACLVSERR